MQTRASMFPARLSAVRTIELIVACMTSRAGLCIAEPLAENANLVAIFCSDQCLHLPSERHNLGAIPPAGSRSRERGPFQSSRA